MKKIKKPNISLPAPLTNWFLQIKGLFVKKPVIFIAAFMLIGLATLIYSLAYSISTRTVNVSLANCSPTSTVRCFDGSTVSGGSIAYNGSGPANPTDNSNYQANLNMLLSSPFRNKNEDTSPYLKTPSNQLPMDILAPFDAANRAKYGTVSPTNGEGKFRVDCEFSHFSYDDPILYKNQPGAAHLHVYWGNTNANAYSDYNSIINSGGGTCNGKEMNRTAYWAPAMLDDSGKVHIPYRIEMYYKSFRGAIGQTKTYPENLQIIADSKINKSMTDPKTSAQKGNLSEASTPDQLTSFWCTDVYNGKQHNFSENIPYCDPNYTSSINNSNYQSQITLETNIKFPQCYRPNVDPTDYKNNLTAMPDWYSGNCPTTHPDKFSNLEYRIWYKVMPGDDTRTWFLSSDIDRTTKALGQRGASVHADWFGGWNKQVQALWVAECNNKNNVDCSAGFLGGSLTTDNQYRALKFRTLYQGGPNTISGAELKKAICPNNPTVSKPSDIAYCK